MADPDAVFFEVQTPFDFCVRVSQTYWDLIVGFKHPAMRGREAEVIEVLRDPDEVRQSRKDKNVYLYYRRQNEKRWICAVVRRLNGDGFLITTYPTNAIKEGERIWSK